MANEQSRVLVESPMKADQSDKKLLEIFDFDQIQNSPGKVNNLNDENGICSQGTANFGDGLDSLKAMKTKSFTSAKQYHQDNAEENRLLQG